jgi:hypothetical protein
MTDQLDNVTTLNLPSGGREKDIEEEKDGKSGEKQRGHTS